MESGFLGPQRRADIRGRCVGAAREGCFRPQPQTGGGRKAGKAESPDEAPGPDEGRFPLALAFGQAIVEHPAFAVRRVRMLWDNSEQHRSLVGVPDFRL